MEKAFRPIPLETLARWVFRDLDSGSTVLGIPGANLQVPEARFASAFQGKPLAAPLGLAAGPHTQLAQNLVAGWLCGARFMELKTVQALDELEISRPCIDAADATFNCEWSQELRLEQSFDEYLKAWVLIHALAHRLGLPDPGTHFAMSVGYTLEGIQGERVQRFIARMRNAGPDLDQAVEAVARVYPAVRNLEIPARLSEHITLSTMHGCPPSEIERIARFLLCDMGVHTWVKLNPTLLGPERLRGLLNGTLDWDIEVPDAAFEHDPRFEDAMAMVRNLADAAKGGSREFGLKLSNTLEVVNRRGIFPEREQMMYLSGRALHPLTLTLAAQVDAALGGGVPISFCGGADALNFPGLVACGLGPVTVCTELLKPGGYARLQQFLANLGTTMEAAQAPDLTAFQRDARKALAEAPVLAAADPRYARRERPLAFKGPRKLGPFDCIAAPCQEACPAHQNIPDYLWQIAQGRPQEALETILRTNPLPGVTGSICDHPCTERCVRNFYEGPLAIRELKRAAFEGAKVEVQPCPEPLGAAVAVIGAGPAGISAAFYAAQLGFAVTLHESRARLGGMVGGAVPRYRLADEALPVDLERLEQLGVKVKVNSALGRNLQLEGLRRHNAFVFLGMGTQAGRRLGVPGEELPGVVDALDFLDAVREGRAPELGQRVLVVGGGNSAMDAARTARRIAPETEVTVVYRRTSAEMPADPEEVHDCLLEGVRIRDLRAPEAVEPAPEGHLALRCTPMTLGDRDASGRPRPVPSGAAPERIAADTILVAIGQEPRFEGLEGLRLNRDGTLSVDPETGETNLTGIFAGGDASRGPATVIKALADGRRAAVEMGRRQGRGLPAESSPEKNRTPEELLARKARREQPLTVPVLPLDQRKGFTPVLQGFAPEDARLEAARCLDCDELCSLCVTTCPNRANQAYAVPRLALDLPVLALEEGRPSFRSGTRFHLEQAIQVFNLGDACNACGNCTAFCPTAGDPCHDKPQLWLDEAAFLASPRDAFHLHREGAALILHARLQGEPHRLRIEDDRAQYTAPWAFVRLDAAAWTVTSWEPLGTWESGSGHGLEALGTLIALSHAAAALPL